MAPPLFWGAPTLTFTRGCFAPSWIENRGGAWHLPLSGVLRPSLFTRGCFAPSLIEKRRGAWHLPLSGHPRAGGFWALGCSDPLFSTVRSLLPASSSSARDHAAAWISLPCNFRLQFRSSYSTEEGQLQCRNPACSVQQIPKYSVCSVYSVFVPGIC